MELKEVHALTKMYLWFLVQIEDLVKQEQSLADNSLSDIDPSALLKLKRSGFSDKRLAKLLNIEQTTVRNERHRHNIRPVYKRVDTCAAEFATHTAYMYSTYEEECEAVPTDRLSLIHTQRCRPPLTWQLRMST